MAIKLGSNIIAHEDGYVKIPSVTTAERDAMIPANGMLIYNTSLSVLQQYADGSWQAIEPPPTITGISPTSYNGDSGASFTISGANFKVGAVVKFITSGGAEYSAASTSRTNSSTLTATTPQAFTTADEPISVKVVNASGLAATLDSAVDVDAKPIWNTASGTIATVYDYGGSYSPTATLSATDPEGGAITYSVQSGSLYGNGSLNTSNGQISGDPTNVATSTTYSFTAGASDGLTTSTRSFNIIVNPTPDGSTAARAANSALDLWNLGLRTDGYYYINVSGSPEQVHCLLSSTFNGGFYAPNSTKAGWTLFAQTTSPQSLTLDIETTTGTIGANTTSEWARGSWKQGFDSTATYTTETEVLVDIDGAHTLIYNGWRGIALSLANSQIDIIRGYSGSYQVLRNGEADWNNVTYTANREGGSCTSCYRPHYKVHNANYGDTYTRGYTNSHNGTYCSDWCQDGYGLAYTQRIMPYLSRSGSCFSGGSDPCGYQGVSLGNTGSVARFYFRQR